MNNLEFRIIRKCYGFEWETYYDIKDDSYLAICHISSASTQDKTWEGLWEKIVLSSKEQRKNNSNKNWRKYDR